MSSVKKNVISGFAWDFLGNIGNTVVSLLVTLVLARLLTPEDYGLVAMATVVIFILNVFIEGGMTEALIQNKKNTPLIYNSIFYLNIGISILASIVLYITAGLVSDFYENKSLTPVLQSLTLLPILNGLSMVQNTILVKQLKFRLLSIRNIVGQIVGGIAGIIAAYMDFGVFALVIYNYVSNFVRLVLLWWISDWRPSLSFSYQSIKPLLNFSFFVFISNVFKKIFDQVNTIFVGKAFAADILGNFGIANGLNQKITGLTSFSLEKVFFPILSKIKDNKQQYISVYETTISVVGFVSIILLGILYIWIDQIILTFYGEKWEFTIFIFKTLIFGSFATMLNPIMMNALKSQGKAKEKFVLENIKKCTFIAAIVIGYYYGFEMFLYALAIAKISNYFINVFFLKYKVGIPVKNGIDVGVKAVVSIIIIAILYDQFYLVKQHFVNSLLYSIIFVVVYFGLTYLLKDRGVVFIIKEVKTHYPKIRGKLKF